MIPGYVAEMTLEEQIGQLFVAGFWGTTPTPQIIDLIQRYRVGGIILFSRNVQDAQQLRKLTTSLQAIAREAGHRHPLLITLDQENGMVQRLGRGGTQFPGNMALGAIGSEQMAYDVALATGRELKSLGVNMNLAPVADVNNNPSNPVIGIRSFGEDPQQVARLVAASIKGYRAAGVIATLKHFPGHGDTAVDSHMALPMLPFAGQRLEEVELVPFRSGIEAGADCVMIAHLYLPSLMHGEVLPATVSREIISGLLREELGYDGVVISDCLEMKAVADTVGVERGAVLALQAGTDLVLISHLYHLQRGGIEAVRAAVQAGQLSAETIRQAVERVLKLKERYLSWDELSTSCEQGEREEHQRLRDRAYDLSTTLVRNDEGLLPLGLYPDQRVLIVFQRTNKRIMAEDRHTPPHELLAESIRRYHPRVETAVIAAPPAPTAYQKLLDTVRGADVVIVLTVDAFLDAQQAELMSYLLQTDQRIIGIAVRNPYDLLAFPQLRTYLVTYEYTPPALDAAARVLFGVIEPQGRLPVSLPGLYPRGGNKREE